MGNVHDRRLMSSRGMDILYNGFEHRVAEEMTLLELLKDEGEPVSHVVVELNGRFVLMADYATTLLKEGDQVEVILPAFGG